MMLKSEKCDDKAYSYDEAIDLAGNGRYNLWLLLTLSVALWAMCTELFGISVVVSLCSCDFGLDITQKSILVSMPFAGPVITAYIWGYISDTQGRKKSLVIGMSGSFVMSSLCAFSPNWIVLAVLKLIGTCFCSCAQSVTYTLLGESCPNRMKNRYMLIMSGVLHLTAFIYFLVGYIISQLDFAYDLGFITFVPWRLLVIILALPFGLAIIGLLFCYESPKFLLNDCREDEALDVIRCINLRNGGKMENFPVQKLMLIEDGNARRKDVSLLKSLWEQTAPLFKPPLLSRNLLLYYLIFVVYFANSSLYIWLPYLADAVVAGNDVEGTSQGLCTMISQRSNTTAVLESCTVDISLVLVTVINGAILLSLTLIMTTLSSRKRLLVFGITLFSMLSCLATTLIPNLVSIIFYFGVLCTSLTMGPLFSFYVDLFPTSYRGMAACLGTMIARFSSIVGINVVGPIITAYCNYTFYGLAVLLLSGVLMACLLPPDKPKKVI